MQTKVCTKCGEEKAVSEYYKQKSGQYGVKAACKLCLSIEEKKYREENKYKVSATQKKYREKNKKSLDAYHKKYREENKEKIAERHKKYCEENREKELARQKKWRKENKKETSAQRKKYREENKYKVSATQKKWREENKDKIVANRHKRRARKAGNGGSFTAKEFKALKKKYDYKCLCCGEKKKLTADHVIPVSKGGTSNIDNIQPLCQSCNSSKGAWHSTDYRVTFSPESKS